MVLFSIEILYLAGKKVSIEKYKLCKFCIFYTDKCELERDKYFLCGAVIHDTYVVPSAYIEEIFI